MEKDLYYIQIHNLYTFKSKSNKFCALKLWSDEIMYNN